MKEYKLYTNKYLSEKELTENDLHYLFDTPSLNYSLVVNMFKFTKNKLTPIEVLNLCKTNDRWMYETHWTKKQRSDYREILIKIFRNIYGSGPAEAEMTADWWLLIYGMSVEGENLFTE